MDLLKPLIALLAIVNPIGVVPFFIHFTQGFSREQRRRTIHVSAFAAFCVIAVSALAGLKIIEFFGISLASFQVGGGMLLLISALQMLNAQPAETRAEDVSEGDNKVDAADYVIWRDNEGTSTTLPNDNGIGGTIGQAHYDLWKSHFGNATPASGSGIGLGSAAVPEPATLIAVLSSLVACALCRRR